MPSHPPFHLQVRQGQLSRLTELLHKVQVGATLSARPAAAADVAADGAVEAGAAAAAAAAGGNKRQERPEKRESCGGLAVVSGDRSTAFRAASSCASGVKGNFVVWALRWC